MRRDLDLIRQLALRIADGHRQQFEVDGYSHEEIDYHLRLMIQGYLIINRITPSLTHRGRDFVDSCRDEEKWRQLQVHISKSGLTVPFSVIESLLRSQQQ